MNLYCRARLVFMTTTTDDPHTNRTDTIGRRLANYCMLIFVLFVPQLMFLRFLYTLYVAVDANFKIIKGKQHHLDNVKLMPGWCAFVPETPYQTHIKVESSLSCFYLLFG